jgi:hypothetical protein
MERSSKEVRKPTREETQLIGYQFWSKLNREYSKISPKTYKFVIGTTSEALAASTQLRLCEMLQPWSFGVELERENPKEHSKKPEWNVILKILQANGGAAIVASGMLCSMNFEAKSTSPICSVGSIDIPLWWKSKEVKLPLKRSASGLRRTKTQETGMMD